MLAAALALAGLFSPVQAQPRDWPNRPVRIIVPTPPGGSFDFFARTFGRYFEARTRQPVVVDNKPGAGAILAAEATKAAAPDGYTFLVGGVSSHSANPALYAKLPYDPGRDFVEVGMLGKFPYIALTRKSGRFANIAELIALARANPGKLTFGYSAASSQVPAELLKQRAAIDMLGVPYKSITQIHTDIAGGIIDFAILDAGSAAPGLSSGLLVPLAVTSSRRVSQFPGVPTMAEALPGYEYEGWAGLSAPAGTPAAIVEAMNEILRRALADSQLRETLERQGLSVQSTTVSEQAAFAVADRARWADWVRMARIPKSD